MWQVWLVIAVFFLAFEIITTGFLVFWFAIGALIAMCASFFISNVIVQTTIFLISSTILLFATRSFVQKVTKKDITVKTNVYSIENKIGKVTVDISPIEGKGQIKINGETWSAKSYNDLPIKVGTEVTVEKVDGVKAIVRPL